MSIYSIAAAPDFNSPLRSATNLCPNVSSEGYALSGHGHRDMKQVSASITSYLLRVDHSTHATQQSCCRGQTEGCRRRNQLSDCQLMR